MTPEEYCKDKAAQSGSSFYYSFRFLPTRQRQAIMALYAFCREVDDVVDKVSDAGIARKKLAWWREEIQRLYHGQPQHPVTMAMQKTLQSFDLPQEQLEEILDGMEMDLDQNRYSDFKELQLYCHRVASVVGLLSAEIFGYQDRNTLKYAHDLGMAFQLTNIIRDVREDASRNRIYLPQDSLTQFGVSENDILQFQQSKELRQLLQYLAQQARTYYQKAFDELPAVDRYRQRAGLIMAAVYQTTLDEIERDGFQVMKHRIILPPHRKLWIVGKSLLREKWRHLF